MVTGDDGLNVDVNRDERVDVLDLGVYAAELPYDEQF